MYKQNYDKIPLVQVDYKHLNKYTEFIYAQFIEKMNSTY